jgi:hypothetical protein
MMVEPSAFANCHPNRPADSARQGTALRSDRSTPGCTSVLGPAGTAAIGLAALPPECGSP